MIQSQEDKVEIIESDDDESFEALLSADKSVAKKASKKPNDNNLVDE
jgi:hypothetical protein